MVSKIIFSLICAGDAALMLVCYNMWSLYGFVTDQLALGWVLITVLTLYAAVVVFSHIGLVTLRVMVAIWMALRPAKKVKHE